MRHELTNKVESPTQTIPDALRRQADASRASVALQITNVGHLTHHAWHERSNAVARGILARGVASGDRILLPADTPNWLDYAIAYVAVHKAGAVAVPVATRLGEAHVGQVAQKSSSSGVIELTGASSSRLPAWTASLAELETGQSAAPFPSAAQASAPAEILYTSGTTGTPKGVVATHANLLYPHKGRSSSAAHQIVLHSLPPATTAGQSLLIQCLASPAHTMLVVPHFTPAAFLTAIQDHGATELVLVPTMALSLIHFDSTATYDLSSVRIVRTTGAAITPTALRELDQLFPRAVIMNMYGSTESWPARTRLEFDPQRPESVGRPSGGSSVRIVDSNGGAVARGVAGHVELRLAGVPRRSYHRDPDATAEVFRPDGWVRMGDIGYLDDAGYLYLVDRCADLIISGGVNISTLEIEDALQGHAAVHEAAAFGLPHPTLGEYVAAAVTLRDAVTASELRSYTQERLGPYKAPRSITILETLPRNALGKVLKRELRAQLTHSAVAQPSPKKSSTERTVLAICADVLDRDDLELTDDFVALGGTSLSAMEIVARLADALNVQLSANQLFTASTLGEFAQRVGDAPPREADPLGPITAIPRTPYLPPAHDAAP